MTSDGRLLWVDLCTNPGSPRLPRKLVPGFVVCILSDLLNIGAAARQCNPDIACIEFDYPDLARLRAVRLLKRVLPDLPLLMFTEYHSEALAVWAFRTGVWDYRVKPVPVATLAHSMAAAVAAARHPPQHLQRNPPLPDDLIEPAGHLQRPHVAARRTGAAVAYITMHFDQPLERGTLARICGLSCSEFSRVFKREHGLTFASFLLQYRIARARDFLAEPRSSVSEAALAAGFNDLSHFGRSFRRLVGVPASEYRKSALYPPPVAVNRQPHISANAAHKSPRLGGHS
jgi:AraC-like DNA-binding protein